MSKRDEVASEICGRHYCTTRCVSVSACQHLEHFGETFDAILALLADPDDRMVDAMLHEIQPSSLGRAEIKAAIRAAMQAAGE